MTEKYKNVSIVDMRKGDIIVHLLDDNLLPEDDWDRRWLPALLVMAPTAENNYTLDILDKHGKNVSLQATKFDAFTILVGTEPRDFSSLPMLK